MTHTTEKQKKNQATNKRILKWFGIILSPFILLIVIAGIFGSGNDETTDEAPETVEAQEAPEETEQVEEEPAEEQAQEEEPEEERRETDNGLDAGHAQLACTNEADRQAYPDKLKVHTVMGKKHQSIDAEEIRFLWEATLESSTGGEIKGDLLCIATGSNDNTRVEIEFR